MLAVLSSLTVAVFATLPTCEHAGCWKISQTSITEVSREDRVLKLELRYATGALFAEGEFEDGGPPFYRARGKGRILYPDGRLLAAVSRTNGTYFGLHGRYYFADGALFAKVQLNGKARPVVTLGKKVQAALRSEQASFLRTCPHGTSLHATGPDWSALSSKGKLFGELIEPLTLLCVGPGGPNSDSPEVSFHPNGRIRSTLNDGLRTFWYANGGKAAEVRNDTARCFSEAGTLETSCDVQERARLSFFAFE